MGFEVSRGPVALIFACEGKVLVIVAAAVAQVVSRVRFVSRQVFNDPAGLTANARIRLSGCKGAARSLPSRARLPGSEEPGRELSQGFVERISPALVAAERDVALAARSPVNSAGQGVPGHPRP